MRRIAAGLRTAHRCCAHCEASRHNSSFGGGAAGAVCWRKQSGQHPPGVMTLTSLDLAVVSAVPIDSLDK